MLPCHGVFFSLITRCSILFNYLLIFLNFEDFSSPPLYFSLCLEIWWSWVVVIDTASLLMELRQYFWSSRNGRISCTRAAFSLLQRRSFLQCDIQCFDIIGFYTISNMYFKLLYTHSRLTCLL